MCLVEKYIKPLSFAKELAPRTFLECGCEIIEASLSVILAPFFVIPASEQESRGGGKGGLDYRVKPDNDK